MNEKKEFFQKYKERIEYRKGWELEVAINNILTGLRQLKALISLNLALTNFRTFKKRNTMRFKMLNSKKKTCSNCEKSNYLDQELCVFCGYNLSLYSKPFNIEYKIGFGGVALTERQMKEHIDAEVKNPGYLLQPQMYDKHKKQWVLNPDFVKLYGAPKRH